MANGAFNFKDNSGNVVSFISGSGSDIIMSGGTLDLSGMTGLTLGNLTMEGTVETASFAPSYLLTSSFNSYTGTTDNIIGSLQTSTSSLNSFTSSADSRLDTIEGVTGSYATTGSNTFNGNLTVTGYIDAQELRTTYISSSILYRSGSTKFGDELSDTHAFTGSLLISGSSHHILGSFALGTITPSSFFHVNAGNVSTPRGSGFSKFFFTNDNASTTYFEIQTPSTSTGDILFSDGSSGDYGIVGYDHSTDSMRIYTKSAVNLFISGSGQVGVGTITPDGTYGKLTVNGSIRLLDDQNTKLEIGRYSSGVSNSYIKLGSNSNSLRFTNNTDTADLMYINNNGSIGLGIEPSSWGGGYKGYEFGYKGTGFFPINPTSVQLSLNYYYDGTNYVYANNGIAKRFSAYNDGFSFESASSGTTDTTASFISQLFIKSDGNVGINESSPISLLHFSKQTIWGTSTNRIININNTGTGGDINVAHNMGSITWYSGNDTPTAEIAAYRNTPASGNNVELRFITAAGGVPYERYKISSIGESTFTFNNNSNGITFSRNTIGELGSIRNSGSDILYQGTGTIFINADSNSDSTSTGRRVKFGNRGTSLMLLDESGRFGIGTDAPVSQLDVIGNIKNSARVYSGNSVIGNIAPNLDGTFNRSYLLICDLNDIAGFSLSGFMNAASYTTWNISSFYIMKNYSSTTASAGITGMYKAGGCDMNIVDLNYGGGRYIAIGYTSNPEIDVIWTGYRLLHMLNADGSAQVIRESYVTVNSTLATY